MNGGKGKTFWLNAQNRRLIFSPSHTSKCKIETYWLKHFFPFIFSFHSKSEPMNICPCSTFGNNLIFLLHSSPSSIFTKITLELGSLLSRNEMINFSQCSLKLNSNMNTLCTFCKLSAADNRKLGKISRITELLKNRKENNEATPGKDPTNFLQHGL